MRATASAEPTWIPAGGGDLAGWVHRPAVGPVVGAVVLVPATDREQVISFRAWYVLASELARAGHLVVRFAFRGDGDSSPLLADDVQAAWQQDLDAAIDLAASLVPGMPVTGIGLRLGASVLAASTNPLLGRRLAWEPVSGRRYLRGHVALRAISVGQPSVGADEGVELIGEHYRPEQAASLKALPGPGEGVELRREEDREVAARLHSVTTREARIPRAALAQIVDWVPRAPAVELEPFVPLTRAATRQGCEQLVRVGPDALPGIWARPDDDRGEVAVLFCAAGSEPKDGPTGLWARAARELAGKGVASLRVERRGCGDLLVESEDAEPNPYRPQSADDLARAVQWLRWAGYRRVVAVGLSAAGWLFVRATPGAAVDTIVMVNNVGWHPDEAAYRNLFRTSALQRLLGAGVPTGDEPTDPVTTGRKAALKEALKRLRRMVLLRVPDPLWRVLARRGLVMDAGILLGRVPDTTRVVVVQGVEEAREWEVVRGPRAERELARQGVEVQVVRMDSLDHALLGHRARGELLELVVEQALATGSRGQ